VRLKELARLPARRRSVRRRHRILEVEDQSIGARFEAARELSLAIGRDKQQRAHRHLPCLSFSGARRPPPGRSASMAGIPSEQGIFRNLTGKPGEAQGRGGSAAISAVLKMATAEAIYKYKP